jgi:predicted RNA-binding protein
MRTSLAWIQPHHHGAILRCILNTVNSFLCSSTNYLENQLLPDDLIIVKNHGDDKKDVWDTKDVLESPRDVHNKVEIQINSKF